MSVLLLSLVIAGCCTISKVGTESLWAGVNNVDIFDEPDSAIDEMLSQYAASGLKVIRIIVDFRLELDEDGNALPVGSYNDCILNAIDDLMAKARQHGLLLLVSLDFHNWKDGSPITISESFYGWRKCKTPFNVYARVASEGPQTITEPYAQRDMSANYLSGIAAKDAYKQRVVHILNHVNPHFGLAWKDIDDVIWAWGLQSEPEHLAGGDDVNILRSWMVEMADHVKSIDPDTYVVLGTKDINPLLGNIPQADVYTLSLYPWERPWSDLAWNVDRFNRTIGEPFDKRLLVLEFNSSYTHVPGANAAEYNFEWQAERSRALQVPWMFWEHGYYHDDDDIWHADNPDAPLIDSDGVFWGAKLLPAAKRIGSTQWGGHNSKKWKVNAMVADLCSGQNASCTPQEDTIFVDTFSSDKLGGNYEWLNETPIGDDDWHRLNSGHLQIHAGLGQDLWGGYPVKKGAPMLLRQAPEGNYSAETLVRADLITDPKQPINTQIGLFVYQDQKNWIFFGLTNHDFTIDGSIIKGDGLIVTTTISDVSWIVAEQALSRDQVFLKVERVGNQWRFLWKPQHAESWTLITTTEASFGRHRVGMGSKSFDFQHPQLYGPVTANFDYFMITR